jgi:uncharacterized protein (DUF1778 family)
MRMDHQSDIRDAKINIRIDSDSRDLIDTAAKLQGKNRSAFMLEAAIKNAQRVLLNQTHFYLEDSQWEEFNKALEFSPDRDERLKALLKAKPLWK